ncbi:MAG: quinone oxidoreductase family protein [Phenylobacterium sp.]
MLAAILNGPGPPDAFVLEETPKPTLSAADDVLVQVKACGVSSRDIVERNGTYRRDVTFPLVIGLEIAGVVEAAGPQTDLRPGDHVCSKAFSSCGACRYCRTGRETTCLKRRPVRGGYAEYVVLPEDAWVRFPLGIPFEIACSLGPGAGVALNAVRDTAHVKLGETVLVTGASGGVGRPSVQLAKLAGAQVIALTRDAGKAEDLRLAGADEVIVAAAGEDFSSKVRALSEGEGADVIIDTVGSRVFDAAFNSLALHGRYAFVGQLFSETIAINPARIFFKRAQLLGVGSVSRAQLADVIAFTSQGLLNGLVGEVLPLREIAEAHRLVETAAVSGRVVVVP